MSDLPISGVAQASFEAKNNDPKGIVSRDDARRIVDAAVDAVNQCEEANQRQQTVDFCLDRIAGLKMDANDLRAINILTSFAPTVGVPSLEQTTADFVPATQCLPEDLIEVVLENYLEEGLVEPDTLRVKVKPSQREGTYRFDFMLVGSPSFGPSTIFQSPTAVHRGTICAVQHHGEWFVADVPVSVDLLDRIEKEMKAYFDEEIAPDWEGYATAEEITQMREAAVPQYGRMTNWGGSGKKWTDFRVTMVNPHLYAWVDLKDESISPNDD